MGVPDCIPLAIIHTVHSENETVKQQMSYLFGKENIHQAMVKNKTKTNKVEPIWRHCKVTFLSEWGTFFTGGGHENGEHI